MEVDPPKPVSSMEKGTTDTSSTTTTTTTTTTTATTTKSATTTTSTGTSTLGRSRKKKAAPPPPTQKPDGASGQEVEKPDKPVLRKKKRKPSTEFLAFKVKVMFVIFSSPMFSKASLELSRRGATTLSIMTIIKDL